MANNHVRQDKESDALASLVAELKEAHNLGNEVDAGPNYENGIADIVTFCNDSSLLNLPGNGVRLYPAQKIVLKALYMGARGNRRLKLTAEEWEWLLQQEKLNETVAAFIDKLRYREQHRDDEGGFRFSELNLVLGRRSGKTTVASIIAVYEAYKLMVINDGNPFSFYSLPEGTEIAVLNVATSQKQATRLFNEIRLRISQSPFFKGKIDKTLESEIHLFTGVDLRRKADGRGNIAVKGSVLVQCGHSNPASLRGAAAICIIFDELAFYDESRVISGKAFYEALRPSVAQFSRYGDGMVVTISSPGSRTGIFYKLWHGSFTSHSILSLRMPTWIFNPTISYDDDDLIQSRQRDPAKFRVEYGGEWPEGGFSGKWFTPDLIDKAIASGQKYGVVPEEFADPTFDYYIHVDPATSQNNYALVVVRKMVYRNDEGKLTPRILLSKVRVWQPMPGQGLNFITIGKEVLEICKAFRPVSITYDQWNSDQAIAELQRNGFNCFKTTFNRGYKLKIYTNLRELMLKPESALWLYDDPWLIPELRNLSWRQTTGRTVDISADKKNEDVNTDDCADCLAGAANMACGVYYKSGLFCTTISSPLLK